MQSAGAMENSPSPAAMFKANAGLVVEHVMIEQNVTITYNFTILFVLN